MILFICVQLLIRSEGFNSWMPSRGSLFAILIFMQRACTLPRPRHPLHCSLLRLSLLAPLSRLHLRSGRSYRPLLLQVQRASLSARLILLEDSFYLYDCVCATLLHLHHLVGRRGVARALEGVTALGAVRRVLVGVIGGLQLLQVELFRV